MTSAPAKLGRPRILDPLHTLPGRAIYDAVGTHRYLTNSQLTDLLYSESSAKYTAKWTKRLREAGKLYADNVVYRLPGERYGSSEMYYSRQAGLMEEAWLEHLRLTNDTLIKFERYPRERDAVGLHSLYHDLDLKDAVKGWYGDRVAKLNPDGMLSLQFPNGDIQGYAIEADRGTESYDDPKQIGNWHNKLSRYQAMISQRSYEALLGTEYLQIAVVIRCSPLSRVTPEKRLRDLRSWIEQYFKGEDPAWLEAFYLTYQDPSEMTAQTFLEGEHWIRPGVNQWLPLVART